MELLSSHTALLVSIGVCAYIGVLHLGLLRGGERAHGWVAAWCLASLVFMSVREVQLHATEPRTAVAAARIYAAMSPLLVLSLVGFVRALRPDPPALRSVLVLASPVLALSCSIAFTGWFVPGETRLETDWFGRTYIAAAAPYAAIVLGPIVAGGLVYGFRGIARAPELTRSDRALMIGTLALYAAMGVVSILSAADLIPVAGLAEFGPLVVCVGLNQTLVRRHVRLRESLGEAVAARTAELRAANRKLSAGRTHYRALFDHVPAAVTVWSPEGDLVDLNQSTRDLLHLSSELPAVNAFDTPTMVESGAADQIRRAAITGRPSHAKLQLTSQERTLELLVSAVPVRTGDGDAVDAVMQIGEDIGERRELEESLRQAQKLDALGRLAAGIAHEINNPLAYVRSNLGLLRGVFDELPEALRAKGLDSLPEGLQECDEVIDDSVAGVERVIALVRDIKGYAHGAPTPASSQALAPLVADSVRIATVRRPPGVEVEERYADDLPCIECQPNRLEQVFVNLVSNAIDAVGERGRIGVSTHRSGDHVVVAVSDDGCGMDEETRQRVLEPFFTTKPVGEGTGLGLYVARDIVRWHRGELRIDSAPGEGSRFEVWLPIERDEDDEVATGLGPATRSEPEA